MSDRYPGGFLKVVPPELDPALGNAAPGMWTLEQYLKYQKAGTWPAYDPYFSQTVLSLHGNGANGAQNNTFLDSSTNNFTITRAGNTTQGTFSPFSAPDGRWSNYFDGVDDHFIVGTNADWTFLHNGSSWTIEFDIYHSSTSLIVLLSTASSTTERGISIQLNSTVANDVAVGFFRGTSGSFAYFVSSANLVLNSWNHVGITFDTSTKTCTFYINGVQRGSSSDAGFAYSASNPANTLVVGVEEGSSLYDYTGYLSNLRISNVVRTGMTSVPTAPYTSDADTELLTCQSSRFVDNSANGFAITAYNNVKVTPFSPFAPTAAYDASVNGGSGYFDGSGDYLAAGTTSDFNFIHNTSALVTIEAWVYRTSDTGATMMLAANRIGTTEVGFFFGILTSTNLLRFGISYGTSSQYVVLASGNSAVPLNAWTHVCVEWDYVSDAGTFYINGVADGTFSKSNNASDSNAAYTLKIGAGGDGTANPFPGYISNLRISNDIVYGGAFTPSTSPLTTTSQSATNVELLTNFTNAGIFDNTGKNNLETVADAQIDTTTKKYGTGSMEFDGTGDYLVIPDSPDIQLGTGPFTIEAWIYPDATSGKGIVAKGTGGVDGLLLWCNNSNKLEFAFDAGTLITSSASISTGVWTHVAVVREGTGSNQTKLYINGTNDGTGTVNYNFNQTVVMRIGTDRGNNASSHWDGFIDDLRITKGVARYTSNFTPQTSQWQDQ